MKNFVIGEKLRVLLPEYSIFDNELAYNKRTK